MIMKKFKTFEEFVNEQQEINESFKVNQRVKLTYKGIHKNDELAKFFNGQKGTITSIEDGMYRVKLDNTVELPDVGKVTNDLWDKDFLKKINEQEINESKKELEIAKKEAQKISKEEGVVQHVNKTRNGGYRVEDWYDSDNTVASYNNGMEI